MANQCGREPRRRRRLILFSAGVDSPRGKLPNFRAQCRLWRVFSDAFSAAFFHSDRTETTRGKEVGRRCCFETVGSVVALPESTPAGLGKTGIGEDIARRGHFGSIGIASSPADLPVQGGEKRRWRKATFANQLRGVVAFAESPWPLTRTQTGADEKSARCAILAGSPWIILRGS